MNMKLAWLTLIITALTDGIITAGTALTTAMVSSGAAALPGKAVVLVALLGGLVAMARTVQQALKATPEQTKALKGE
jgi:ribosomal protein L10